ncbi:hypothetical protein [Pseudoxanthomonas mexicana]
MPIDIDISGKDFVAIWGATLSTVLGVLKVAEYWRDRFRLEIDYDFTNDPSEGNKITLRNLTARPITIPYRELLMRKRWHFFRRREEIPFTDEPPCDVTIPAHSSHTFEFREMAHFSLKSKMLSGKTIYLKLWIAGRKPVTLPVYTNEA